MSVRSALRWAPALAAVALLSAACATPIGVIRGSTQEMHRALTVSVLSAGKPSGWSTQVLHRTNLFKRFEDEPGAALGELRKALQHQGSPDRLFALSELSFLHAEQSGQREHYLASAVYAYAFLFPEDGTSPDSLDPRRRLAADLYNRGLTRGLASRGEEGGDEEVVLEAGTLSLPFGELVLTVEPRGLLWGGYRFKRFIPVGEFEVRGLRNRYRQAGIGAPLAAEVEPVGSGPAAEVARKRIPPRIKVPVTAFLRLAEPRRGVVEGKLRGRVEVYAADQASTVRVNGRDVPLELEPTAALAYQLEGAPIWDFEIAGFRFAEQPVLGDGLVMMHPYRPGRIPVVLVHGTASSPARWAEMINELANDPTLRKRFQPWLFMYNTGQPVLYSAHLMRRAVRAAVAELDPAGQDPALRRMVLIGHSQGGLLIKLMAVSSGTRFWDNVSSKPFEEVDIAPETRQLLQEAMFFEPLQGVERVVFIATPHRGSFRATGFALKLMRRIIRLPGTLVTEFQALLKTPAFGRLGMSQLPTSVDNMSPGHHFIRTLAATPVDPRITAHSIIAVKRAGPLVGQTDGVVAYESAHIEGVASELVVRSGHSTQSHPETIEEVRRILREHVGAR
ncbi:MAG: esterase/lipase family protein [Candidatus Methylomirabilales bacterium]